MVLRCRGGARWPTLIFFASIAAGLFCLFSLQSRTLNVVDIASPSFSAPNSKIELTDTDLASLAPPKSSNGTSTTRRMRLFMPADGPNINLCKTVMSGVALGYPLPTLLNWDGDFNRPEWHFAGSHIAKLESLLAVIEEMLDNQEDVSEDDLAVMVDAYDIWFQLPPSVLIQRFLQLNKEANERNKALWEEFQPEKPKRPIGQQPTEEELELEQADFPIPPPEQAIIVTGAKDCQPDRDSGSDPHYDLWPESPMPMTLYGDETDIPTPSLTDASHEFRRIRPRCVNSGMIMGTMGAMRDALRRSKEKVDDVARSGRQLWSDQGLFAEVIGDQEAWRLWVRELAATWNGTDAESSESTAHEHVRKIAAAAMEGQRFEFGIGLDYNFTTIPPTCSSEEDGYFNQINDKSDLASQSTHAGVPGDVRIQGTPPELENAQEIKAGPWAEIVWGAESLYSDFFFGVTPVGIHHNAYKDGLKPKRLKEWWPLMWFHRTLRDLVTYSLQIRKRLERTLFQTPREDKETISYVAPQEKQVTIFNPKRGDTPASFAEIGWDAVCQKGTVPWYEELFDDGKGAFEFN